MIMKINSNSYTPKFLEIVSYCNEHKLFIGEGNPNAKILIIGKEINDGKPEKDADADTWIKENSAKDVERNLDDWSKPDGYDLGKIKTDIFHKERNPTWTNYQKMVGGIIGHDLGRDNYNFLDYCFMTELSDIHLPNSNYHKSFPEVSRQIEDRRVLSVKERSKLFMMPFFRNFPIVIMACGHYPKDLHFNIEDIFDVGWIKETMVLSTGNFYNEHYGNGKILIHTRQMSMGVSDELISKIASLCMPFHK